MLKRISSNIKHHGMEEEYHQQKKNHIMYEYHKKQRLIEEDKYKKHKQKLEGINK